MVFLTEAATEPFVNINVWTSIFTLVNLLLLFLVMKKFLFKPVKKMIDSRQKEIDDMYTDAEQSKTDASELKAQYETRLSEANTESEAILKEAHQKAAAKEEEMVREAREQAAQTMQRADEQIAMEKKRAMNEIKNDVTDMAVDIASAVISRDVKAEEHSELIDSFIDKLGENHD